MNIQPLLDKPIEQLTADEKNQVNIHYLGELERKGAKAERYMKFYLGLFKTTLIMLTVSALCELHYGDWPIAYAITMLLSAKIYGRNKAEHAFLEKTYNILLVNTKQ